MSTERSKILQKQQKDIEKYLQSRNKLKENIQLKQFGDVLFQQGVTKLFTPITNVQEQTTDKTITQNQESTNKILASLKDNQQEMNKQLLSLTSSIPSLLSSTPSIQPVEKTPDTKTHDTNWVAPRHFPQYTNPKRTSDMYFLQQYENVNIYKMNQNMYIFEEYTLHKMKEIQLDKIDKTYTVNNSIIDLLFHPNPELTNTTKEDFETYFQIRDDSGYVAPTGKANKKTKVIEKKYQALLAENAEGRASSSGDGIIKFLPSDTKQLINRLLVLLGSEKAGNNNVRNESFAIMDMLLKQNKLSKQLYTKLVNEFFV